MSLLIKKIINSNNPLDVITSMSIENIEKAIEYSADKYYNSGESVVSDDIYDTMVDFLKLKSPKSKVLKNIGAKVKSKNKVKLDYNLGSMDKIKPPSNQLNIWMKKYSPPYNLSDKLDGVSALITFKDNNINLYTRGTAIEGTDITPILKYLKDIPTIESVEKYCKKNNIKGSKNLIAIRGELVMKEKVFQDKWSKVMKNSRNSVAGLVNSKTINPEFAMDVDFVAYELVDPFLSIEEQFKIIKDLKFNIVVNKNTKELSFDFLSKYLKERKSKSIYNIDGIIVTDIVNNVRNVKDNPEYAFAYKDILENLTVKTTIKSIEWNVSKNGYLKPTILIEPVEIGGVTIQRVTGNNAKYIVDNKLGKGAIIEVIRSGDVIPKIINIIKPVNKPDLPKEEDFGKWDWNETKVDIILNSMDNNDVLIKSIYFFFSTLETKGLGEKNVAKIVNSGLNTILKILTCKEEDLLKIEGFKQKTVDNIITSIKKSTTNIPLPKLMAASGKLGQGLGEERMKQILLAYPNIIEEYTKWTKKEFIENIKLIDGWEEKTSSLLVDNFDNFIKFFNSIKKYITIKENVISKKVSNKSSKYNGKIFVLSGFRDKELNIKIESLGGKIGNSISKNTNFLIVKDKETIEKMTDKIKKALELNIPIYTKDELLLLL